MPLYFFSLPSFLSFFPPLSPSCLPSRPACIHSAYWAPSPPLARPVPVLVATLPCPAARSRPVHRPVAAHPVAIDTPARLRASQPTSQPAATARQHTDRQTGCCSLHSQALSLQPLFLDTIPPLPLVSRRLVNRHGYPLLRRRVASSTRSITRPPPLHTTHTTQSLHHITHARSRSVRVVDPRLLSTPAAVHVQRAHCDSVSASVLVAEYRAHQDQATQLHSVTTRRASPVPPSWQLRHRIRTPRGGQALRRLRRRRQNTSSASSSGWITSARAASPRSIAVSISYVPSFSHFAFFLFIPNHFTQHREL